MKKRWLAPLMALLLTTSATATGLVVTNVSADAETTANWTDGLTYDADYAFGGGSGVGGDPYLLSTPEHLAQLAVNLNYDVDLTANYSQGKYFKLTNDIDVSGKNWTPIGNKIGAGRNNTFYGAMDFNGYEVSGISHTGYDGQFFGFFGAFSIGWVKNPKISYGDVTVNYTGGTGSVVDNSGVTTVASFGGLAGCMIGGTFGYDDGSDLYVDIDIEGDVKFTNNAAGRGYHGGLVGFMIGGSIGNEAAEGSIDISVEIGKNGSMHFINNTGDLIYAGGLFGNGYSGGVVGNNDDVGNGDVNISFVNNNKNAGEVGFYVESNGTGRSGMIAGEMNYKMGNIGTGSGDVTISATNYGTVHYLYTKTQMNYSGAMFGAVDGGFIGTKGTGDVTLKMDNYGMIKAENNAAEEVRFGGIVGTTSGAVIGIDNPASSGRVFMSTINHGDAKIFRADNWNYYTAMQFGYVANSIVGTKGTGPAEFVLQTKVDNFYNNSGPLVWLFLNTADGTTQFGSLNGGTETDVSKSFAWMLTEEQVGTGTHGFRFDWQKSAGYEGKIPAGESFRWEIVGANADGAVFALKIEDGFAFDGFADGSAVTTDANGNIVATLTQSAGLPTPNVIDLGQLNIDFSAVDYTGEVLQPTLEGYTVVALNAEDQPLNAVLPATYNVYGVAIYKNGMLLGTKKFDTAQQFTINKLANENAVDTQKLIIDANAETYTVTTDLEVATDADFTNVIANSGSLTDYKGASLFVRIKETATHHASAGVEVAIPAYAVTIAENAGVTVSTTETKTTFLNGAYYEFTVAVNEGYEVSTLVVKANGTEVVADGGVYYIFVSADTTITVEGVSIIVYYEVTIPEYDFATVVPVIEGQTSVKEGETFMFAVETDEEIIVKVNGTEVEAVSGIYTIANVVEDITITVEKVAQPEPPADNPSSSGTTNNNSSGGGLGSLLSGCASTTGGIAEVGVALLIGLAAFKRRKK